ncbi:MAG: helix-turn-helix domain-containing protein [Candidatus Thorarchaeota archaeon]
MSKTCKSIYKTARILAGLTQEQAVEFLNIGVRTLAGYEANKPIPNSDIVLDMVKTYNAEWLGYEHLRQSSELGNLLLPTIHFDMPLSILNLNKELYDLEKVRPKMFEIACSEISSLESVSRELRGVAGAALSVLFSKTEKRPSQIAV